MEIRVIEAVRLENGTPLVSFESPYGIAEGLWSNGLPGVNSNHDVELDMEHELAWAANAQLTLDRRPKLEKGDGCIRIIAQIESIEHGECCVLRLGDSILMADIKNIPNLKKGTFIELKPHSIKIFSTNL